MSDKTINLENYYVQRIISRFPFEIKPILSIILEDLKEGKTKKKVEKNIVNSIHFSSINMIPCNYEGHSYETLVAICYDEDNIDLKFRQIIEIAKTCEKTITELFIFTTQWNSELLNKYLDEIELLRNSGTIINFLYITSKGIALLPV